MKHMQAFEILLLSTSVLYLFLNVFFRIELKKSWVIGGLIILFFTHLIFEGLRWQMMPSYLILVLALLTAFRQKKRTKTVLKVLKGMGFALILIPAIALPSIFPVFELPEINGEYEVGTTDLLFEFDREEVITEEPSDRRKIVAKIWYPSVETNDQRDLYIDQGGRHGFAQKYGLPDGTFSYLDKIETNVYRGTSVAKEKFPVLIFSHGYNSKANNYYALLNEVASHGYVIVALNHTYESTGSTFPDGSEVYFDYDYAREIESGTWETMAPVIEAFQKDLSYEERHPIVKKGLESYFVGGMVERWAQDISDAVSELENLNASGFLKDKLDLNNIGVFGHSRGGGAAGEALLTDDRINAGANIDGVQWGRIVNTSFDDPFLYVSADWPEEKEDLNSHAYINKSKGVFYEAKVLGTLHSNFMDIPLMIPVNAINQAGSIDPYLALEITNELVVSFFDKHLKNQKIDLTKLNSNYEMLELDISQKR
jgi:dienelactone hydrolase